MFPTILFTVFLLPGPGDQMYAEALIDMPHGTLVPCLGEQLIPMRMALVRRAVAIEIVDEREIDYTHMVQQNLQDYVDFLRKRRVELAETPLLCDRLRFPDYVTTTEMIRFNRAYYRHLAQRRHLELDRTCAIGAIMAETDELHQAWDAVLISQLDFYFVTTRREALKELQGLIGKEAYLKGQMPPNVPVWRFADLQQYGSRP